MCRCSLTMWKNEFQVIQETILASKKNSFWRHCPRSNKKLPEAMGIVGLLGRFTHYCWYLATINHQWTTIKSPFNHEITIKSPSKNRSNHHEISITSQLKNNQITMKLPSNHPSHCSDPQHSQPPTHRSYRSPASKWPKVAKDPWWRLQLYDSTYDGYHG